MPIIGAALTIPHLATVLREAPKDAMLHSFLLGAAYGIGKEMTKGALRGVRDYGAPVAAGVAAGMLLAYARQHVR